VFECSDAVYQLQDGQQKSSLSGSGSSSSSSEDALDLFLYLSIVLNHMLAEVCCIFFVVIFSGCYFVLFNTCQEIMAWKSGIFCV